MAMEIAAQRLQMGDVLSLVLAEHEEVEATVVRHPDRTLTAVRATLRIEGREDVVKEWSLGELVTVLRGP
jgi:hypothetical protein